MRKFLLLALALVMSFALSAQGNIPDSAKEGIEEKPAELSYNFSKGYVYPFYNALQGELEAMGMGIKFERNINGKATIGGKAKTPKGNILYKVKGKLDRIVIKTEIPDSGGMEFDSDDMEGSKIPEAPLIQELVKNDFSYFVSKKNGKIFNFSKQMKKLTSEIKKRVPKKLQEAIEKEVPKQMEVLRQIFINLPEGSIKPGHEWQVVAKYPIGILGNLLSKNQQTYLGVGEYKGTQCAKVYIQSKKVHFKINPEALAKAVPMLGQFGLADMEGMEGEEMPIELKFRRGKIYGEIWISLETGEIVHSKITGDLTLMLTLFGADGSESKVKFVLTNDRVE